MLIDWFTVAAQALNFVVLVWLLGRFLYKPVLKAVDAREKKIAAELSDAAAKETQAEAQRAEFQRKNEEFDRQRAELLKKATDEAKAERDRLLEEARKAADALTGKRQEAMRIEAVNLDQAIRRRTQEEVFAIARKALTDLATTSLDARMTEVFLRRFRDMDGRAKAALGEAAKKGPDPALVRSAFELPPEQRAAVQDALNRAFSADVRIRFDTAPDLVSGIDLTAGGHKVGWSIADYLGSLEAAVAELLKGTDARDAPAPKPDAKGLGADASREPRPKAEAKAEANASAEPRTEAKAESKPIAPIEARSP